MTALLAPPPPRVERPALALPAVLTPEPPLGCGLDYVWCADALALMRALPTGSVDAVITDPPYGMGLDKWDKAVDIPKIISEVWRVLKSDSWLAFTIQMPYMLDWLIALKDSSFTYKEHVSWLKRNTGSYSAGLCHAHESILLYCKGRANFVETKGKYTDVKVPGLMYEAIGTEGLQRHIDSLWHQIRTGKADHPSIGRRHVSHFRRGGWASEVAPEFCNFTNVWSFLPEHLAHRNTSNTIGHSNVKPTLLFERLCTLLTTKDATICDPFAGSGTTAVAARNTGRHWICGDSDAGYVATARSRLRDTDPLQDRHVAPGVVQHSLWATEAQL